MYQYSEYIVSAINHMHVILERSCDNRNRLSSQHADNVILQPVEIHLDICHDRVVGTRGSPVASILLIINCPHYGIWIEHM